MVGSHIYARKIKWTVFHGSNRTKLAMNFRCYDVVITTYHTVLAEWKRHVLAGWEDCDSLHGFAWYRIVLDEGIDIPKHCQVP